MTVGAHCGISVMPDVVGLPLLAEFADISYGFMHKMFYLTVYTVAASVFRCVASRNKRGCRSRGQGAGTTLLSWVGRSLRGLQQRELRASATGGFGPRDSVSRNYTASFVAPFCWFRPVAHPPERQSRWATRPATLWVANAQPKRLAQLSAHSSSGAPPGARLRRSLRSEEGDSAWNRAIRSQFKRVAKARPGSPPRVHLTAAPLSLRRCRSALESWAYLLPNVARGNSCRIG